MLIKNNNATFAPYPFELKKILNIESAEQSRKLLIGWDNICPFTPIWVLPQIAQQLGIDHISVKDESKRSALGSFKALGAPNALVRLIQRHYPDLDSTQILAGNYAEKLRNFTVISATDGNHGRALAAAAKSIGCPCVIVLHAEVSVERETAIADYGAKIIRITGNYDESVDEAQRLAQENNWLVVSDTSYAGYEQIPADVMQGYGTIAAEVIEQLQHNQLPPVTHVFLQGGVGGMAAGIISYLWEHYAGDRPYFIVVEPKQADCLYQSAINGYASDATGSVDSVMAGLACGKASPLAWQFLAPSVDGFMLINDQDAEQAMKILAKGSERDIPIVAGESGAAGIAGLFTLTDSQKEQLNINEHSHILVFNTEGATAPQIYHTIIGTNEQTVLDRQTHWLNEL